MTATTETKTILFRCSRLADLMTTPRNKAELIGDTAKTFCMDMFLKNEFNYEEPVLTPAILKGRLFESDAMGVLEKHDGLIRKAYKKRISNDFIIGTPDIVLKPLDTVEDVKVPMSLKTFMNAELTKAYYWQGQGYMWLTGMKKFKLRYVLMPDNEEMQRNAYMPFYYKLGAQEENPDFKVIEAQIKHNNQIIELLPIEKRIKTFEFDYNPSDIELLKGQIIKAREYYQTIKL